MSDSFVGDDARQFERTAFAWVRTLLVMTAVAMLAIRGAEPTERWLAVAGAVVALATSAITFVTRSRSLRHRAIPAVSPPGLLAALVAALVVMAGSVTVVVL